jgi:hypothetical protein
MHLGTIVNTLACEFNSQITTASMAIKQQPTTKPFILKQVGVAVFLRRSQGVA